MFHSSGRSPIAIAVSILSIALFTLAVSTSSASSKSYSVTFVIDMRQEIASARFEPARDEVGVRGGVAPLTWEGTFLAADPEGDGRYEATVTFARAPFGGQAVTYKFKIDRPPDPRAGRPCASRSRTVPDTSSAGRRRSPRSAARWARDR